MNYIARVTKTYLGRTLIVSALLLIACAVLWGARDHALTARENSTSTEQPAGPAGSVALAPAQAPPAAAPTHAAPATHTQQAKAAAPAAPVEEPVVVTTEPPAATVTTNPNTGEVGPVTGTTPSDTNAPATLTPTQEVCHVAGCPGA